MTRTIFDIYNDILRDLDGTSIPKETVVSESDFLVLQPGTSNDIYQFYVNPAICNDITVKFQMTNFATVAGEIPSGTGDGVYDPSDYVSSDATLPWKMTTSNFYNSILEKEIAASSTEDVCSVDISNIPFNYSHADILIQYSVKTDGEFDVTWDMDWDLSEQGEFPTNITPTSLIQSDNSDVDLDYIGTNTTLVQRFYIKAIPNMRSGSVLPDSTLTAKVKNNLGSAITLGNVIVKPAFLHYADYPADGKLGSSQFATGDTYPSGDTCYYVKTNGQIIAKISDAISNFNPSMTSMTGHYRGESHESKSTTLTQVSDNKYIFTQSSESSYLTEAEVTLWRNWTTNPQSSYFFGELPYKTYTKALPEITSFSLDVNETMVLITAHYVAFADQTNNWIGLNTYDSWYNAIHGSDDGYKGHLSFSLYGIALGTGIDDPLTWGYPFAAFSPVAQNTLRNKSSVDIIKDLVISRTPLYSENYVMRRYSSYNCGKSSEWDDDDTPEPDPDIDPDVFPTAPEGPSYMQYMLNDDDNWIDIDSNTSLTYIEKSDTGEDPEDYDGTTDQFYIGYKNLNSISYYAPATIAVNCIISYSQFKDTYVYGDYY